MEDEKIVDLYWARSETAIKETSAKYGRYLRQIAYNILANNEDTEECLNDTYLKTWNSIPPQRPDSLVAYIGRIARNLSFNKYKQQKAKKRGGGELELVLHELEECIPSMRGTEEEYEKGVVAKAINEFLYSMDMVSRHVFVRRYWYSDSISDIAKSHGMTESKVKSMLHRIRKKLKLYLEKEGILF